MNRFAAFSAEYNTSGKKHSVSKDLSLSRDLTLVHSMPMVEKAVSASTDDGGI